MIASLFTLLVVAIAAPAASDVIPGQYIVVFKDHVKDTAKAVNDYMAHLQSFAGFDALPESTVLSRVDLPKFKAATIKMPESFAPISPESLLNDDIELIEPDRVVHALVNQNNAPWGLRRISYRSLPSSTAPYQYPTSAGQGIDAYVIDTGVLTTHSDFGGRARFGADFTGEGPGDGNGHGTHCAGTVGATTYGVAKRVNVVGVRVLGSNGSGSNSGIIRGIEWAAQQASARNRAAGKIVSVANLSLGGPKSQVVDRAVQAATDAGLVMVVAAGNSAGDACNLSPAGAPSAITVAASDSSDRLATFSERGPCVDIIAPGVNILSTWRNGQTNTISGTSMAAPHVAGVVALALAERTFTSTAQVAQYITSISTPNLITGTLRGAPNRLLYSEFK
jgi:subtilisin family serine protease